jgi:hypothetical protein
MEVECSKLIIPYMTAICLFTPRINFCCWKMTLTTTSISTRSSVKLQNPILKNDECCTGVSIVCSVVQTTLQLSQQWAITRYDTRLDDHDHEAALGKFFVGPSFQTDFVLVGILQSSSLSLLLRRRLSLLLFILLHDSISPFASWSIITSHTVMFLLLLE